MYCHTYVRTGVLGQEFEFAYDRTIVPFFAAWRAIGIMMEDLVCWGILRIVVIDLKIA